MPFDGRIAAIDLIEGTPVYQGQIVAQVLRSDLDLSVDLAMADVNRLKASIKENDDTSVEQTGLKQSLSFVQSMDRTVEAAQAQVDSGHAKLEYANSNLERAQNVPNENRDTGSIRANPVAARAVVGGISTGFALVASDSSPASRHGIVAHRRAAIH